MNAMDRETLNEYLITYEYQASQIKSFDKRIEELASETEYVEKVVCFLGVKTYTALSYLVETRYFQRFAKGNDLFSILGLVSGEDSSGDNMNRLTITKARNSHIRKLLIEVSRGFVKEQSGINRKI